MKPMIAMSCLLLLALAPALRADQKPAELKVGDPAPTFEATDDQGKTFKSSDVVGKKVLVVYFYPADLTGGCTKQACGFRDDMSKLADKGVEVDEDLLKDIASRDNAGACKAEPQERPPVVADRPPPRDKVDEPRRNRQPPVEKRRSSKKKVAPVAAT